MKKYLPENIAFRASKSDLSPMNNQNFKNYAIYRIKDEVLNESPLDGLIDKDSVKKVIDSNINNSSNTYFFMAFAEQIGTTPFETEANAG